MLGYRRESSYIYVVRLPEWQEFKFKKIKVMFTVEQRSGKDYMGFTWFEIFKNGKTTGNSYNALDEAHAIRMHKQFKK
jgi:hypothetical protein